jgi:hypothetical protein
MFIDKETVLSESLSLATSANAGTTKDTGAPNPVELQGASGGSSGKRMYARFTIKTAPSAGTVVFNAIDSSDGTTFAACKSSRQYGFAELKAGMKILVEYPINCKRHIGASITAGTNTGGTAFVDIFSD